jgi:protein dithiol:quinone oxidoreductase
MLKIHPKFYSVNAVNAYGVLLCAGLLSAGAYFEIVMGMLPCPLCIIQRLMFVSIGLFLLVQLAVENITADRLAGFMVLVSSILGALSAGRQVWLQHLPASEVPVCGPNLDYMLKSLPLSETLQLLLQGSGDCAVVHWSLLGLSMPEWTLAMFISYIANSLVNLYRI